ncbi:unannotated protein [freshwater metagenome]|uniref:Unannotated protein n=1 Tax=freshwater metagenome TaxID=449393 RepID=A0A6J7A5S7_9ZZZZ
MRIIISAQSAASTPPASERIVISASLSSYSPLSRVCTSNSPMTFTTESNSAKASLMPEPSGSLAANSKRIGSSSTRLRNDSNFVISDWTLESLLVIFWALSGSSQRLGTPACSSNSIDCLCNFGRSRTFSIETRVASIAAISRSNSLAAIGQAYPSYCFLIKSMPE